MLLAGRYRGVLNHVAAAASEGWLSLNSDGAQRGARWRAWLDDGWTTAGRARGC